MVEVASRGGNLAAVPGAPMAVVVGTVAFGGVSSTAIEIIDFSDPTQVIVRSGFTRAETLAFGVAVTPDGATALVNNAHGNVNSMLVVDISNPDDIAEVSGVSPIPFPGTGSPRVAVSPDGTTAVVASNLSDWAFVFDLDDLGGQPVGDAIVVGDFPFGVTFAP